MEEETRLKGELRFLHLLEMHIEVGLQDKVKGNMLLENYKKNNNGNLGEDVRLIMESLESALKEPEKAKVTLAQLKKNILEKRKELAKAKTKGRIGR